MARTISLTLRNQSAYGTGAGYTLTATSDLVKFGTAHPIVTLTVPGIWLIEAQAKFNASAAITFAQGKIITVKLRRTNNTANDLTNGQMTLHIPFTSSVIVAVGEVSKSIIYTTTTSNDAVSLFADINTIPASGSIILASASIVAIKIG